MAKHAGGCHCGAVRFEAEGDLSKVIECNCSICSKTGSLLAFVPAVQFRLLSGEDSLSDYQFNKKVIHHLFCRSCGVRSFAKGTGPGGQEMRAINVRCLDGFDPGNFTVTKFDGKSL